MPLNAVCEDIATLLNDNAFGTLSENLFFYQWGFDTNGEEVDAQIMVQDAASIDIPLKEDSQPVFIIYVRGDTNEDELSVYDRARGIWEFMIQRNRETINGTEYIQYQPLNGSLIPLGLDANNRVVYSMSFYTFRYSY